MTVSVNRANPIAMDMDEAAEAFARTDAPQDEKDALRLMVDRATGEHDDNQGRYVSTCILAAERWVARELGWYSAVGYVDTETGEISTSSMPDRWRVKKALNGLVEKGAIIERKLGDPALKYENVQRWAKRVGIGGQPATIWEIARGPQATGGYDPDDFRDADV